VLTALFVVGHPDHRRAQTWFNQAETVATTPITQAGLLRMLLNGSINANPDPTRARQAVSALLSAPSVVFWPDATGNVGQSAFMYALTGHRQVTDLHLLSLAASYGGRLVTFDTKIEAALRPKDRRHVQVLNPAE